MPPNPTVTLDDVLYELALTSRCPNADTINDFVRRYPEHSREIVEFAAELAILSMREENSNIEPCAADVSSAVERALVTLEEALGSADRTGSCSVRADDT